MTHPQHATQTHDEPHGSGDHGDHGESDGHADYGHGAEREPLGPIDWPMWGLGALGVVIGVAVAGAMALSIGGA